MNRKYSEYTAEQRANRREANNRYRRSVSVGKFITVDGESFTTADSHDYVLLAASTGKYIYRARGLTTLQCFTFLLKLRADNPGYKFNGFAFNYDVNMMLVDLTVKELVMLWVRGSVTIRLEDGAAYRIEWMPSKSFQVTRLYDRLSIEICDSFGFFQCSFVKALETWKIADPGGDIARMKGERSNFTDKDKRAVIRYCLSECKLLVELLTQLEASLAEADLKPAKWNGAGAVAARLLQREGVHRYRVPDEEFPAPVHDAIMRAYFGGRVEVFLQGELTNCTNYDIRSAYPSEALHCPDLTGTWNHSKLYHSAEPYALWLVEWDMPPENYVMPFPHRYKKEIRYPSNGKGWYHAKEVRYAMAHYPNHLNVLEGWVYTPSSDVKPFAFIREVYAERAKAKREGRASEKALKLGLNSLYGKTAQGIGYKGRIPRFRSFYWAGMITSGTRARLFDMAMQDARATVSISTDGIVFSGDPGLELADTLGGLERSEYREFYIAQPGIYIGVDEEGNEFKKSRGFFLREIDFPDLRAGWSKHGPYYSQTKPTKRFVGLGTSLNNGNLDQWRTWPDGTRKLSLYSSRKFYAEESKSRVMRLLPPGYETVELSDIYVPKSRGIQTGELGSPLFIQGIEQPRLDL